MKNHRELGQELELFMHAEEAPGMPFFLPKGMVIREELERFWKEKHRLAGYKEIKTPIMMKQHLWEQSGHWDHYHENMYFSEVENQHYAIKPMNCPGSVLIFNQKKRSYRELPMRLAELGLVHRHELSGSLNGLLRVRSFTQDDAHIFVSMEQIEREIEQVLSLVHDIYSSFGFQYKVELSTRPEKYMGELDKWNAAEESLSNVLKKKQIEFSLNEGDGAFYGPKIDFHVLDSMGRSWQCGTIQLDFQMPEKFDCSYIGEGGEKHRPVMIHRAIYGSVERFMAILIEHYQGDFPAWLAPVQAKVIPVNPSVFDYGYQIVNDLQKQGIRVEIDDSSDRFNAKIRQASIEKVPYLLVIGNNEKETNQLTVQERVSGEKIKMTVEEFIKKIKD